VAEVLAGEGAQLRLLVRSSSDPKRIAGLPGETVIGDLTRPETLRAAVAGCEGVVHVAADYRLWIPDPAAMLRANVDGTRELLRAAREAGVRRFVYTSSVATMGFKSDGTIVDEETPVGAADMVGHYKRSKFLAEQEAMAAAKAGQDVIILNPTTPVGPGDSKPTPTGRIIVDFLNRKFPAYVDTGLNLVDVGQIARLHALAFTRGTPGRRYILGGENLTLKQILDRLGELSGLPSPQIRIPHAVASLYATWAEMGAKFTGKEPRATREEVRMGRKKMWASSARAQQELGYVPLPVTDSLRRAIDWFRVHGYVQSS
jgi:dihydroflavonol-4-reductase